MGYTLGSPYWTLLRVCTCALFPLVVTWICAYFMKHQFVASHHPCLRLPFQYDRYQTCCEELSRPEHTGGTVNGTPILQEFCVSMVDLDARRWKGFMYVGVCDDASSAASGGAAWLCPGGMGHKETWFRLFPIWDRGTWNQKEVCRSPRTSIHRSSVCWGVLSFRLVFIYCWPAISLISSCFWCLIR